MNLASTRPHYHRASTSTDAPFTGPVTVGVYQNRAAHGGICRTERCECGMVRKVNLNGGRRELGQWVGTP